MSTFFQISNDKFSFYADYFVLAANAGSESNQSLFETLDFIERVNISTFDVVENALSNKNEMIQTLRSSYEQVTTSAVSLEPMRDAFVALSNHIYKFTQNNLDSYLSSNGLKVKSTYARIHRLATGETISLGNIED